MDELKQQLVDAVGRLFAAAELEDFPSFQSAASSGFFIHENGQRLDASGIFELIVEAQRAGTKFEWHITDPIAHVAGHLASIAYVNRGAVTRDGVRESVTWLETATLVQEEGVWRVAFMSSMRSATSVSV